MQNSESAHPPQRLVRVLVVDGHDDTRALYHDLLASTICEVVGARDVPTALVSLTSRRPDLVILELRLPGDGGLALCEAVRRNAATRTVPIIVVTTEHRVEQWEFARAAGADLIFLKPALPETLRETTLRLTDRSVSD